LRVCAAVNSGFAASGAPMRYRGPSGSGMSPAGTLGINSGAAYSGTTAVTLNLAASDAVGVTGYYLSGSATAPLATASGWTAVTRSAERRVGAACRLGTAEAR